MRILSQTREVLVNMDILNGIALVGPNVIAVSDGRYCLVVAINESPFPLGSYTTKEQAMVVLKCIYSCDKDRFIMPPDEGVDYEHDS